MWNVRRDMSRGCVPLCLLREIRDGFMNTQVQFAFQVMKPLPFIFRKKNVAFHLDRREGT